MLQKQAKLRLRREPLQIPYPPGWTGQKSTHPEEEELFISNEPRWLSVDEVQLVEDFLKQLPYPQYLDLTGAVLLDSDDPLLQATHEEIDQAESAAGITNSKNLPGGGNRSVYERVLLLRERGWEGGTNKAIAGVN